MTEGQYYLWFSRIKNIGIRERKMLMDIFGSPYNIYHADKIELERYISCDKAEAVLNSKNPEETLKFENMLFRKNINYTYYSDDSYPNLLKEIYDIPYVLYYTGDIGLADTLNTVGVVGARIHSVYGGEIAEYFARCLAEAGITVVSGMAAGIDSCAHRGALQAGGKTIAVLGSGIDVIYPRENYGLYNDISEKGLVISENPPGEKPLKYYFPLRNRIISGISRGILVVEAKKKSGSLITADTALEQGREVFAIPGRIFDPLSEGTNNLIKMGATLVMSPQEIIDFVYNINNKKSQDKCIRESVEQDTVKLSDDEMKIMDSLSLEPKYIDEIISECKVSTTKAINLLFSLENKKLIKQPVKGYYIILL